MLPPFSDRNISKKNSPQQTAETAAAQKKNLRKGLFKTTSSKTTERKIQAPNVMKETTYGENTTGIWGPRGALNPVRSSGEWCAFLSSLSKTSFRCTNRCTKTSQRIPISPTVADYRTSNLLILHMPAVDRPPVTAEVASSSLVVPAIFSSTYALCPWLTEPPLLASNHPEKR